MKTFKFLAFYSILAILLVPQTLLAQKEVTKKFTGVKVMRMTTASGDCKFQKSTDGSVTVVLRHDYNDAEFEPVFEQNGERLTIKERFHANSVSGNAQWTLSVPEGLEIRFTTGSGNIEAADMKLNLDATTGSGDLDFRKTTGEISANTGSGNLDLDGFSGEIRVNIGSGSARITRSQGELKVNCGSGNIRLTDCNAEFDANTGSGNVEATNLTLAGSSDFNSGSGDAEVTLAVAPKFDLSVNSGSGNAELNFNGNEIAGEIVMRANKRNGRITAQFDFQKTEEINEGRDYTVVEKSAVRGTSKNRITVSTGSGEAIIRK